VTAHIEEAPAASAHFTLGLRMSAFSRGPRRRRRCDDGGVTSSGARRHSDSPTGEIEVHMIEMAYWKAVLEAEIRWLDTFIDRITSRDIAWPLESRKDD
jgi:hypothetical protein